MTRRLRGEAVAVGVVFALLLGRFGYAAWQALTHFGGDYVAYVGATRAIADGAGCVYTNSGLGAGETAYLGYPVTLSDPLVYPAVIAELVRPLAWLPVDVGLPIFITLATLVQVIGAYLLWRMLPPHIPAARAALLLTLTALALPAADGIKLAQLEPFMFAGVSGAFLLARRGRLVLAGVVLGAVCAKPHDALFVMPALLIGGQWRIAAGFAVSAAVWLGSSVAIVGTDCAKQWVSATVTAQHDLGGSTISPAGLGAVAGGHGVTVVAGVLGIAGLAALVWQRRALARDPWAALIVGIGLSVALAPHIHPNGVLLLAPALVALAWRRSGVALALAVALNVAFAVDAVIGGSGYSLAQSAVLLALPVALLWVLRRVPPASAENPEPG